MIKVVRSMVGYSFKDRESVIEKEKKRDSDRRREKEGQRESKRQRSKWFSDQTFFQCISLGIQHFYD